MIDQTEEQVETEAKGCSGDLNSVPSSVDNDMTPVPIRIDYHISVHDIVLALCYSCVAIHIILFFSDDNYYERSDGSLEAILRSNSILVNVTLSFSIFSSGPLLIQVLLEHYGANDSKDRITELAIFTRYLNLFGNNLPSITCLILLALSKNIDVSLYCRFCLDTVMPIFYLSVSIYSHQLLLFLH